MKKQIAKEPIRLRQRLLPSGNITLYLDKYVNGRREYEYLNMYLIPDRTPFDKEQNKRTLAAANSIKAQRIIDFNNGKAGISKTGYGDMLLSDYLAACYEKAKTKSSSTQKTTKRVFDLVLMYAKPNAKLKDVDKFFVVNFTDWLCNTYTKHNGAHIDDNTVVHYLGFFKSAMRSAYNKGLIDSTPFDKLDREDKLKPHKVTREYLTTDEVQTLINTDCINNNVKRAFLFSCFCGLRLSDIRNLKWSSINEKGVSTLKIQKTKSELQIYFSNEAFACLPKRGGDNERVFDLPVISTIESNIKKWVLKAGIDKYVTFHTARHTHATMLLTMGVDLYVVSKLLGHSDIKTTQIYAEIVDKRKREAATVTNGKFKFNLL